MTARMPCRSSSSNAANTLTKVNIRIQFLIVYGNCNRMSLFSGNSPSIALHSYNISTRSCFSSTEVLRQFSNASNTFLGSQR